VGRPSLKVGTRWVAQDHLNNLSPQQLGDRFNLLAADAREYAIFLLGQDGRLICWNPGAGRLFGSQSREIIGQHFSRFFSPEDLLMVFISPTTL